MRMPKAVPLCKRCRTNHHNFTPCEKANAFNQAPPVSWNLEFTEGFREWGDRMDGLFNRLGTNTFLLKDRDGEEES